jgi:hypothetical protein
VGTESLFDLCQFRFASDETRHLRGQIMLNYIERFDGRELARKICADKLIDMLGAEHIFQTSFAQIA